MSRKKRELSREILKNVYDVINVSQTGTVVETIKGRRPFYDIVTKHKYGKNRVYPGVTLKNNQTKKYELLVLSNIVYAWFNDDYDINLQIDHIDDDPFNNNLFNLRQITAQENNNKRKCHGNQHNFENI